MNGVAVRLLERNADALRAFEEHRFFREVAAGTLPAPVRDAYFRYERRFVEQAVVIVSLSLSKAPALESRRRMHQVLRGLLFDQEETFAGIFANLGLEPVEAPPARVAAFCEGMTRIVTEGSYAEGVAAMLVAEHTYARVSRRMAATPAPDPQLRIWFDLHAAREFQQGAAWLADELDRFGAEFEPSGALDQAVLRAAQLEVDFHDAAYEAAPNGDPLRSSVE